MYRTFNMGIGMVLVVEARVVDRALSFIKAQGEKGFLIGEIGKGKGEVIII
jgi:phosphoribosylformylglycinamidine cyclo-ligase